MTHEPELDVDVEPCGDELVYYLDDGQHAVWACELAQGHPHRHEQTAVDTDAPQEGFSVEGVILQW